VNLLIIIEGSQPGKPSSLYFDRKMINKVYLLYLSSPVKALQYKRELQTTLDKKVEIEIINQRKLVDFEYLRKILLDSIGSMSNMDIGNVGLSEYLTVGGLNMWWASGIVEATPYKRNVFQNFYYLSAVRKALQNFDIGAIWFHVNDASLEKDLMSMFKNAKGFYSGELKNYRRFNVISWLKICATPLKWLIFFVISV